VLIQLSPPLSKQEYNDKLDRRLLAYLDKGAGAIMTLHAFFERLNSRVPGIENLCTHPKEDQQRRLAGTVMGLQMLGIRGWGSNPNPSIRQRTGRLTRVLGESAGKSLPKQ
jgi:hypothetical protein